MSTPARHNLLQAIEDLKMDKGAFRITPTPGATFISYNGQTRELDNMAAYDQCKAIVRDIADKPNGRPSKYDPSFCERVIEWGKQGKSKTWMAANLDVDKSQITRWEAAYEEFRNALSRAMAYSQAYWEELGHDNIKAQHFAGNVWQKNMSSRFREDWGDVQEIRHSVVDEAADVLGLLEGKTKQLPSNDTNT